VSIIAGIHPAKIDWPDEVEPLE